ncbi:MAG TPA: NAD(P)-dependent oxidoreductase [Anaerolineae bacterium]|nr:NAD(P)-dependent oxidoreductase [Anaerolineae bacterium]
MNQPIGFIGLGNMGQPMALNLLQAGYSLNAYNRTAAKTEPLIAQGATAVAQPSGAATPGGIVVSIVSDDAALEEVVMSAGFLEQLGQDGIHLSMSTVSPATSRKLADVHARHGSHYVDAPVFGLPPMAAARELRICVSGPTPAKERVRPLLEAMGQHVFDFGEGVGAANTVKLSGNFISFTAVLALAEVLSLAQKSGIDPMVVVEMFTQTLFPIPAFQYFGRHVARDPEQFSMGWIALKDTSLFKETATQAEVPAPMAHFLYDLLAK